MKIIISSKLHSRFAAAAVSVILAVSALSVAFFCTRDAIRTAADYPKSAPIFIIDAGHGGVDGGTSASDGTLEKDINLEIAASLNAVMRCMGFETVMVRTQDVSVHDDSAATIRQKKISDLHNRLNLIETTENAVFLSIHQNYFQDSSVKGTQVFYSKNNPASKIIAECIQSCVAEMLQPGNTRVVKAAGTNIFLLHNTTAPAVMIECGFLSNSEDTQNIKSESYRAELSFSIAYGIIKYLNLTEEI